MERVDMLTTETCYRFEHSREAPSSFFFESEMMSYWLRGCGARA